MSEKEEILRNRPFCRWAVCRPRREPVEIASGDLFRVEFDGELRLSRMKNLWSEGYYSVDNYPLRDGRGASFFDRREWYAKLVD